VAKKESKRVYNIPVEIRTGIPCKDREDFLSSVQIVFRASCGSAAAKKKFEEEVGHVVYFLSRRPK
jgi:hypothetical protein